MVKIEWDHSIADPRPAPPTENPEDLMSEREKEFLKQIERDLSEKTFEEHWPAPIEDGTPASPDAERKSKTEQLTDLTSLLKSLKFLKEIFDLNDNSTLGELIMACRKDDYTKDIAQFIDLLSSWQHLNFAMSVEGFENLTQHIISKLRQELKQKP